MNVQFDTVIVPWFSSPPPKELLVSVEKVQLVTVAEPLRLNRPPPSPLAKLPLMVTLVSVSTPPSLYRPPPLAALPPVIVSPEMDAVTFASNWNTRLSPPPLIVTPAAGPVIVCVPLVLLSSSWLPVSVIVCGVANTVLSNVIVLAPAVAFAEAIAWRKSVSPATAVSVGLFTTNVERSLRSSSATNVGRIRRPPLLNPNSAATHGSLALLVDQLPVIENVRSTSIKVLAKQSVAVSAHRLGEQAATPGSGIFEQANRLTPSIVQEGAHTRRPAHGRGFRTRKMRILSKYLFRVPETEFGSRFEAAHTAGDPRWPYP